MIPEWNSFINGDCMEYLKEFPDNYFSLALVDPPYGGGLCEGGGCMGRWEKYHQNTETPEILGGESVGTDSVKGSTGTNKSVTRTGGTWAEKYTKKSYRGTLPLKENTSNNSFVSHGTK